MDNAASVGAVPTAEPGGMARLTGAALEVILRRLREPFDPALISWVVKARRNKGKQGLVLPYADPRAYSDRLDELFTPVGWTRDYTVQVVEGIDRRMNGSDRSTVCAMVLVVCRLSVKPLGHTHSGTGEGWADDSNVLTSCDARAFKRACACFGLGRYLYDVAGSWVNLDEYDRPLSYPALPAWALPGNGSGSKGGNGKRPTAQRAENPNGSGAGTVVPKRSGESNERTTGKGNRTISVEEVRAELKGLEHAVGSRLYESVVRLSLIHI